MHPYEEAIAESLNKIANKEIYFSVSEIMDLSDEVASEIVGKLELNQ